MYKPTEPTKPKEILKKKIALGYINEDGEISVLQEAMEGATHFEVEEYKIYFYKYEEVPNELFDEEMADYRRRMLKYEKDMEQWQEYNANWQVEERKKQIDYYEKQLSRASQRLHELKNGGKLDF